MAKLFAGPPVAEIPTTAGVYRFSDSDRRVIYVGKANNLKSRLSSYFQASSQLHLRTIAMLEEAAGVDWTVVTNEVEALQLEYTWIKEFAPRFNIKYRDDKSYPWLALTTSEPFPRVMVGRGAKKPGNRYFGPYSHAWAIRETVDLLLRVFPMRSCTNGVFKRAEQTGRPCLLNYIDKCAGPCVGNISESAHREIVENFADFLAGNTQPVIRQLETQMKTYSNNLEYEKAARIRDDLTAISKSLAKQTVVLADGTSADVLGIAIEELEIGVQVFHVRDGRIKGRRGWVADRKVAEPVADALRDFLLQLYAESPAQEIPKLVLLPELPTDLSVLTELFSETKAAKVKIKVPTRGEKAELLSTVTQNAVQLLQQHKSKRASDLTTRNNALVEIQTALQLAEVPLRIECYDISNLQGNQTVASMVVFEDGLAKKSEYRRFKIVNVVGQNDVAAIKEVLTRRLRRLQIELAETDRDGLVDLDTGLVRKFAYQPHLIVVDGGLPQLNAAAEVLAELGFAHIPVCGLAKKLEEVFVPNTADPIIFSRTSEALYLLQRVRDEAHRFAITHHRKLRSSEMVESALDDVPGLGSVRRKAILKHFGSLRKLKQATAEEIAVIPGIGQNLADQIVAKLYSAVPKVGLNTRTGELEEIK